MSARHALVLFFIVHEEKKLKNISSSRNFFEFIYTLVQRMGRRWLGDNKQWKRGAQTNNEGEQLKRTRWPPQTAAFCQGPCP